MTSPLPILGHFSPFWPISPLPSSCLSPNLWGRKGKAR